VKKSIWFLLLGVFLSYFISPYLPFEWGWDGSFLEWLQVAVLSLGLILNILWWHKAKVANHLPMTRFLLWVTPLWLVLIGFELQWGAIFYVTGFDPAGGPSFISLEQLSYGPFIYPLLAVLMILWLYTGFKYGLYKIPHDRLKEGRFPISVLIITVLAFVFAILGHVLSFERMEELNECFAYLGVITVGICVKKWIDYVILRVQSFAEIRNTLYDFDTVFNPALSQIIPDLDGYAEKLQHNAVVYIAKDEINTLGFIAFYDYDSSMRRSFLTQLGVRPEGKKKKIGQALMDLFIAEAKSKGKTEMALQVYKHNDAAIRFYQRNGFEFSQEATVNSMYMQKKLG